FFFSSRRRHTRFSRDWSSDVCSSDLEFIREHKGLVNWDLISRYQKLSESFISEHKELVDWWNISRSQKLSEGFIREHKELVNWRSEERRVGKECRSRRGAYD